MHTQAWDREGFQRTLHEIGARAQLSQAEFAALAGRSRSTFNRWTRAEVQPTYEAVAQLAKAIRVRFPELADLTDDLIETAGYGKPASRTRRRTPGGQEIPAQAAVAVLQSHAEMRGKSVMEVLLEEGLETRHLLPPGDPGDPILAELLAADLTESTRLQLIRMHLENRHRRFAEAADKRKAPDGG